MAETIEEACERTYTTNNSSRLNLNDNSWLLVTTAVDPRYRLSVFPPSLKSKVDSLLELEVRRHSCRDTGQSDDSLIVPPKNPKPQSPTNIDPKSFLSFYSLFETETTTHKNDQQDTVNVEIAAEIKILLLKQIYTNKFKKLKF